VERAYGDDLLFSIRAEVVSRARFFTEPLPYYR
jgi:hypothetical protein